MPKLTIIIEDEKDIGQLTIDFKRQSDMVEALELALPFLIGAGIARADKMDFEVKLGGVPIQRSK